ncbi:pirin family protein [Limnobacter alexandrii]|uniref:pirin family protein n=1 Tax=Limnobacter alexandrii TaxID=2570352 RepID=UPI00110965EE|nr:pirin family protein [Limnobacter alexandrii]
MNKPTIPTVNNPRTVEHIITGQPTSDGAGVKLTRVITQNLQRRLDPFLMLDNFGSDNPNDYIAGFPNHPHRGFETITYMIAGRMLHEDSKGNRGLLENGGVQWMTAGRGVFHSEIPQQEEGVMEGFQLWLNLPAKDKMCAPWYRDFTNADLPQFETAEGVAVTAIAGNSHGVEGAVSREGTQPLYLDLHLPAGSKFVQNLAAQHNAVVFVYRGEVKVAGQTIGDKRMAILKNEGDGVVIEASADAKALLIAGKPLNEPIAQYGPFVMNTEQEIRQALQDFREGTLA